MAASLDVAGRIITAWLTGGVAGRSYAARIEASTDGGRVFEWFVGLLIDPTQAANPLASAPSPGFGTPVTWGYSPTLDFSNSDNSGLLLAL